MTVFHDLSTAIKEGYHVYDQLVGGGYLLRMRSDQGFVLAVCEPKPILRTPAYDWNEDV